MLAQAHGQPGQQPGRPLPGGAPPERQSRPGTTIRRRLGPSPQAGLSDLPQVGSLASGDNEGRAVQARSDKADRSRGRAENSTAGQPSRLSVARVPSSLVQVLLDNPGMEDLSGSFPHLRVRGCLVPSDAGFAQFGQGAVARAPYPHRVAHVVLSRAAVAVGADRVVPDWPAGIGPPAADSSRSAPLARQPPSARISPGPVSSCTSEYRNRAGRLPGPLGPLPLIRIIGSRHALRFPARRE